MASIPLSFVATDPPPARRKVPLLKPVRGHTRSPSGSVSRSVQQPTLPLRGRPEPIVTSQPTLPSPKQVPSKVASAQPVSIPEPMTSPHTTSAPTTPTSTPSTPTTPTSLALSSTIGEHCETCDIMGGSHIIRDKNRFLTALGSGHTVDKGTQYCLVAGRHMMVSEKVSHGVTLGGADGVLNNHGAIVHATVDPSSPGCGRTQHYSILMSAQLDDGGVALLRNTVCNDVVIAHRIYLPIPGVVATVTAEVIISGVGTGKQSSGKAEGLVLSDASGSVTWLKPMDISWNHDTFAAPLTLQGSCDSTLAMGAFFTLRVTNPQGNGHARILARVNILSLAEQ